MSQLTRPTNKSVLQGSPVSVLCIITLLCQSGGNEESARAGRDRSRSSVSVFCECVPFFINFMQVRRINTGAGVDIHGGNNVSVMWYGYFTAM